MRDALRSLKAGERPSTVMDVEQLKQAVGFPAYAEEERYKLWSPLLARAPGPECRARYATTAA